MFIHHNIYTQKHMGSELLHVLITHAPSGFQSSLLYNHTYHNKISNATFHACSLYEIWVHVTSFLYNHSLAWMRNRFMSCLFVLSQVLRSSTLIFTFVTFKIFPITTSLCELLFLASELTYIHTDHMNPSCLDCMWCLRPGFDVKIEVHWSQVNRSPSCIVRWWFFSCVLMEEE